MVGPTPCIRSRSLQALFAGECGELLEPFAAAVPTFTSAPCGRARSDSGGSTSSGSTSSGSTSSGSTSSDSGLSSASSGDADTAPTDAVWPVNLGDLDSLWVTPSRRFNLVSVDLELSPQGFLGLQLRCAQLPQRQHRRRSHRSPGHRHHRHSEEDDRDGDRNRDRDADPCRHRVRQRSAQVGKDDGGGHRHRHRHRHRRRCQDDNDNDRGRTRSRGRRRGHKQQRGRHEEAAPWEITLQGFDPSCNPYLNAAMVRASTDPANRGSTAAAFAAVSSSKTVGAWLPVGAVLRVVDGCEVLHPQQFAQLVDDARERHLARVAKLEALSPGSGARVRTALRIGFDVSGVMAARRAAAADGDDDDDDHVGDDATRSPRLKLHTTSSKSMLSRSGAPGAAGRACSAADL